ILMSSATTVKEAIWLEENGADIVIAQGAEAGGHRGMFLTGNIAEQPGTFALVPQVADAVGVPVIAAGGIADGRGIAAAFALGARGVQIGTPVPGCAEEVVADRARGPWILRRGCPMGPSRRPGWWGGRRQPSDAGIYWATRARFAQPV